MISNFLQQAAGDANDPFLAAIIDRLKERDILLEIISVDAPEQDAQQRPAKDFNLGILQALMKEVHPPTDVSLLWQRCIDSLLGVLHPGRRPEANILHHAACTQGGLDEHAASAGPLSLLL